MSDPLEVVPDSSAASGLRAPQPPAPPPGAPPGTRTGDFRASYLGPGRGNIYGAKGGSGTECTMKKPILAAIAGAVVVSAAALWFWFGRAPETEPPEPVIPPVETGPSTPPIAHPLPSASAALPSLADSDPVFGGALMKLVGTGAFKQFVRPENLIRHIVVTVDNLAKPKLAVDERPVVPTRGKFLVEG